MSIIKPFCRIWKPLKGYGEGDDLAQYKSRLSLDYLRDERFVCQAEIRSLVTTSRLILQDIYELFNYIEPTNANLSTYSHRIYELFLRTATEFETNCKGILEANGYTKHGTLNIADYYKIAPVAKLQGYKVIFERWEVPHEFKPFANWNQPANMPLTWYQQYNEVKHNRYKEFPKANLGNLMNAFAGLLSILYAQYGVRMNYGYVTGLTIGQEDQCILDLNDFTIKASNFLDEEKYDFIWEDIKTEQEPVVKYTFV